MEDSAVIKSDEDAVIEVLHSVKRNLTLECETPAEKWADYATEEQKRLLGPKRAENVESFFAEARREFPLDFYGPDTPKMIANICLILHCGRPFITKGKPVDLLCTSDVTVFDLITALDRFLDAPYLARFATMPPDTVSKKCFLRKMFIVADLIWDKVDRLFDTIANLPGATPFMVENIVILKQIAWELFACAERGFLLGDPTLNKALALAVCCIDATIGSDTWCLFDPPLDTSKEYSFDWLCTQCTLKPEAVKEEIGKQFLTFMDQMRASFKTWAVQTKLPPSISVAKAIQSFLGGVYESIYETTGLFNLAMLMHSDTRTKLLVRNTAPTFIPRGTMNDIISLTPKYPPEMVAMLRSYRSRSSTGNPVRPLDVVPKDLQKAMIKKMYPDTPIRRNLSTRNWLQGITGSDTTFSDGFLAMFPSQEIQDHLKLIADRAVTLCSRQIFSDYLVPVSRGVDKTITARRNKCQQLFFKLFEMIVQSLEEGEKSNFKKHFGDLDVSTAILAVCLEVVCLSEQVLTSLFPKNPLVCMSDTYVPDQTPLLEFFRVISLVLSVHQEFFPIEIARYFNGIRSNILSLHAWKVASVCQAVEKVSPEDIRTIANSVSPVESRLFAVSEPKDVDVPKSLHVFLSRFCVRAANRLNEFARLLNFVELRPPVSPGVPSSPMGKKDKYIAQMNKLGEIWNMFVYILSEKRDMFFARNADQILLCCINAISMHHGSLEVITGLLRKMDNQDGIRTIRMSNGTTITIQEFYISIFQEAADPFMKRLKVIEPSALKDVPAISMVSEGMRPHKPVIETYSMNTKSPKRNLEFCSTLFSDLPKKRGPLRRVENAHVDHAPTAKRSRTADDTIVANVDELVLTSDSSSSDDTLVVM